MVCPQSQATIEQAQAPCGRDTRRSAPWSVQRWGLAALLSVFALLLSGMPSLALGQDEISREHKVKAAYLYNLGRYITWPEGAFNDRQAPFVIGLMEPAPLAEDLQKIAEVKTIDGRSIVVRRFNRPDAIRPCHILFLPRGLDSRLEAEILQRFAGSHTLLVGESEVFLDHGGVVAFVARENTVRLVIALEAAQRESLQISSKLLQIAQTLN